MRTLLSTAGLLLALSFLPGLAQGQESESTRQLVNADNLDVWFDKIRPCQDELTFLEIPWRATLQQAVVDASRENKPILLWAMNGHPLGCT